MGGGKLLTEKSARTQRRQTPKELFGRAGPGGYNHRNHLSGKLTLACPFFVPTERADDLALPHPARLPLGAAWRGSCSAPGHERAVPDNQELEGCNLGYATTCSRLPEDRKCDAVRLGVVKESGTLISLQLVFESRYRPAGHESLDYDTGTGGPPVPHGLGKDRVSAHLEPSVQRQAECFLQTYLERRDRRIAD
jgi:hypothetical protein